MPSPNLDTTKCSVNCGLTSPQRVPALQPHSLLVYKIASQRPTMWVHLLGSCVPCRPGGDLQAEQSQSQGGPDPGRLAMAAQPLSGLRHGLRVLMRFVDTARNLYSS